jgi:hypothetical protein
MAYRFIILLLLLTTSLFANAESWKLHGYVPEYDSTLYSDDDAYNLDEYVVDANEKSIRLVGIFKLQDEDNEIIDANQCRNDGLGVIVLIFDGKRFDEYWDSRKNGISDIIGSVMCNKIKPKKETKPKLYM